MSDTSLITKYIYGDLEPRADFIYHSIVCLDLNTDQASALIDAHFGDITGRFMAEYEEVLMQDAKRGEKK